MLTPSSVDIRVKQRFHRTLFRCEKEEDLAMIAAQQYFIEYGTDMNSERLMNLLPNYIPDYCLTGDKPVEHWHQLIIQAFKKVNLAIPIIT